jgi:NAD(P)-dependent dehydrogenase (short-subunit alcohol dehydrogenase family)
MNVTTREAPLRDRVAIVTGGTGGIGSAVCLGLAREGAAVVVAGRRPPHVQRTVDFLHATLPGASVVGVTADVASEDDMQRLASTTVDRFGAIDILVTCAGILTDDAGAGVRGLSDWTAAAWDAVMATNLTGVFLGNRAVIPAMTAQGQGDILNLASTSGRRGQAYAAAYSASKAGVIGFSESLAEEVRTAGIRVQVAVIGPVRTAIWEQNRPVPPPERLLEPDSIAELVLFMLTRPRDTVLPGPVIAPFRTRRRPAWRASGAAGVRA